MDKRTVSIFSIVIGILLLALAAFRFINGAGDLPNLTEILIYSITGSILFFYGVDILYAIKNHGVSKSLSSSNISRG